MKLKQITASLLTLTTITALPVAASAQSSARTKIAQCNRIVAIVNAAVKDTKAFTNSGQAFSPEAALKAANSMDAAARQLENLSITDKRLQGYRSQFARMYRQTSNATRNFVNAYNQRNRDRAESALQALQAATGSEKQLVEDINNYCSSM